MRPLWWGCLPPYFRLILTPYQSNDDTMTGHPRSDRGLYLWSRVFTIVRGVKYLEGLCWKFSATADKYTSHTYTFLFLEIRMGPGPQKSSGLLCDQLCEGVRTNTDIGLGYVPSPSVMIFSCWLLRWGTFQFSPPIQTRSMQYTLYAWLRFHKI